MSTEMQELAAFFYQKAVLAYYEYVRVKNNNLMGDDRDLREALNAAVALYHLRERVPPPFQKLRTQLAANCPDYNLLGDIVNATKHNVISRRTPQVIRADSIYQILVCTRYSDHEGEYDNCEKIVEVKLVDGSIRNMYEVLTNVMNMWLAELHQIGAIDRRSPIDLQEQGVVAREYASRVNLEITQGIRWKQHMRFQRYNYETNRIDPVDLSDAEEIAFTVRKPTSFELQFGDDSGLKGTREIQLTPDQSRKLALIKDVDQQNQYLLEIAVNQGIVDQVMREIQSSLEKD